MREQGEEHKEQSDYERKSNRKKNTQTTVKKKNVHFLQRVQQLLALIRTHEAKLLAQVKQGWPYMHHPVVMLE